MYCFHMVLHLIRSGEFLSTNGTGEDFPLVTLVIQERVSLEAVLVFEGLLNIKFGTFSALINAFRNGRISEEI